MSGANVVMECPGCGKRMRYPQEKAGAVGICPGCKKKVRLGKAVKTEIATPDPEKSVAPIRTQVSLPAAPAQTPAEITRRVDPDINRFASEGQNPEVIEKLLNRIREICTESEDPLYMAVQQKPAVNISPDAVVLTNRRALIFRQKVLGRMDFVDILWMNVKDVHVKEGFLGATLSIQGFNGHIEEIDYLPKVQARKVYRIGQEMEEKMIEFRRDRKMEEDRNAAGNITVNTAVAPQVPKEPVASSGEDLVERMSKLKAMLDAGLISESEFAAKKEEIIDSI